MEPIKIAEKYVPNKYGTILKDQFFTHNLNNISFYFKLINAEQGDVPVAAKTAKKGAK